MKKMLILDDHEIVYEVLADKILESIDSISKVDYCADYDSAINKVSGDYSIVMLDISLKNESLNVKKNGLDFGRFLRKKHPEIKILIYSGTPTISENLICEFFSLLNPEGYISKDDPDGRSDYVIKAIGDLCEGKSYFSKSIKAIQSNLKLFTDSLGLTIDDYRIITYLKAGYTDAQIAPKLFIAERTVSARINILKSKLDIEGASRSSVVLEAFKLGYI